MPILVNNPILSTQIFIAICFFVVLVSCRRKQNSELFPHTLTQELKGLAILAVIFSHVGYFLSVDHRFLFPLSIMAGVGVNLFLFLSGYGLTMSAYKNKLSAGAFYKKRLLKLFVPFWVVILSFFWLDYFFLHTSYSLSYIVQSLLGLFPHADLFLDIDSPFWFLTPVLFYYLIFPLVFFKKRAWLTSILIYTISYIVTQFKLPISIDVLHLYQLHLLAFPLGIAFASLLWELDHSKHQIPINIFRRSSGACIHLTHYAILITLLIIIGFTAYHSGVGENPYKEQTMSLITMSAIIAFFIINNYEIKSLYTFGFYSYEIYLIHWPLMSRYDLLFKRFPGWFAMVFYLGFFLTIAWALRKVLDQIYRIKTTQQT